MASPDVMKEMANNWGAPKAVSTPVSPNVAAVAGGKGESVMLPKVKSAWGNGWEEDASGDQKKLPGPVTEKEISVGSAIGHLVGAKLLTHSPTIRIPLTSVTWHIPSIATVSERGILDVANAINTATGVRTKMKTPDRATLDAKVAEIERDYRKLFPDRLGGMSDDADLVRRVISEAIRKTHMAFRIDLDRNIKPNESEKIVAAQLEQMVGDYSALEIREVLRDLVHAQAADESRVQMAAAFTRLCPDFNDRLNHLLTQRPTEYYSAPWLTTEVMLPSSMQPDVENTHWAITPGGLIARRVIVKGMREDQRRISMGLLNNASAPNAVIMADSTPPYVDVLRKKFGRWFEPAVNYLAGQDLGGMVVFRQLQTEGDPLVIAVPDPKAVNQAINKVAGMFQGAQRLATFVNGTVMNVDNDLKFPIRPAIIRRMLPPLALEVDINRTRDGAVDLTDVVRRLDQEDATTRATLQEMEKKRKFMIAVAESGGEAQLRKDIREKEIEIARTAAKGLPTKKMEAGVRAMKERLAQAKGIPNDPKLIEERWSTPRKAMEKRIERTRIKRQKVDTYVAGVEGDDLTRLGVKKCANCGGILTDDGACQYCS